jgi:glyoxylase-like metal-dependent hydrolase (beta-lactamase superfamily II)
MSAIHRLKIGETECALVSDGDLQVPLEILFPRNRRELWPTVVTNAEGLLVLSVICLVIWSDGQVILVDAGNGTRPGGRWSGGGQLITSLAAAGVAPEDVTIVVFTHAHADHVDGTTYLRDGRVAPAFPNARHLLTRADWEYFTEQRQPVPRYVEETLIPLREWGLLDLVTADVSITSEVDLLSAPGHTPGNSVVRVASRGEALFFLGDLVHHPAEVEHLDLMPDGDVQPDLVPGSRKRIFDMALAQTGLSTASHLPFPGLGYLKRRDDGGYTFEARPVGVPTE